MSYWTAYLKANYQSEYGRSAHLGGRRRDKAAVYLADCRRLGIITVLPPDVNESVQNFASVGETSGSAWVPCATSGQRRVAHQDPRRQGRLHGISRTI